MRPPSRTFNTLHPLMCDGVHACGYGRVTSRPRYVQKAMKVHWNMKDFSHTAKCHLHTSAILGRLRRHDEAIRCNAQVDIVLVHSMYIHL